MNFPKMMKPLLNVLIGMSLTGAAHSILFPSLAGAAAGGANHGAEAVVCRDSSGKILSSQILDLVEEESLTEIIPPEVQNLETLISRIDPAIRKKYFAFFYELRKRYAFLQKNRYYTTKLDFINDRGRLRTRPSCPIEQLASFTTFRNDLYPPELWISQHIVSALTPRDFLALELHEVLFWIQRDWANDIYSNRARELNGMFFRKELNKYNQLGLAISRMRFSPPEEGIYETYKGYCKVEVSYNRNNSFTVTALNPCFSEFNGLLDLAGAMINFQVIKPIIDYGSENELSRWHYFSPDHKSDIDLKTNGTGAFKIDTTSGVTYEYRKTENRFR